MKGAKMGPKYFKNGVFSEKIEKYTIENSNFQSERDYISLSHIHLSVDEIINQFKAGFKDTVPIRLFQSTRPQGARLYMLYVKEKQVVMFVVSRC